MLTGFLIWATGAVVTAVCFAGLISSTKREHLANPSAITLYVAWPVALVALCLAFAIILLRKIASRFRPYRNEGAKGGHPQRER